MVLSGDMVEVTLGVEISSSIENKYSKEIKFCKKSNVKSIQNLSRLQNHILPGYCLTFGIVAFITFNPSLAHLGR